MIVVFVFRFQILTFGTESIKIEPTFENRKGSLCHKKDIFLVIDFRY